MYKKRKAIGIVNMLIGIDNELKEYLKENPQAGEIELIIDSLHDVLYELLGER